MSRLHKFKKFILDILFPVSCLSCGKPGKPLCNDCLKKITLKKKHHCPLCKKVKTPRGEVCFSCKKKYGIDGILIAGFYKKNNEKTVLAQTIHHYKYRFVSELGKPLGKIIKKAVIQSDLSLPDIIIPVPIHKRRLRWRTFNQSELMANYLGKNLLPGFEIEVLNDIIIRKKYTPPQAKIKNRRKRLENLKNVFAINNNHRRQNIAKIKGKNIFLIDDVATTGATLFECAKILKKNKVKRVFAIVLARQ